MRGQFSCSDLQLPDVKGGERGTLGTAMNRTFASLSLSGFLVWSALIGCNSILGLSNFTVRDDAGEKRDAGAAPDSGCMDPTGFGGKGCYRCEPLTAEQLASACTTAAFETFDNVARLPGFDPADPKPALAGLDAGQVDASVAADAGAPSNDGGMQECTFTELTNPVLIVGATGYPYDVIARAMAGEASLYYREVSSCAAIDALVSGNTKFVGPVKYFSPKDGSTKECFASEHPADLAPSALFPETCKTSLPNDVSDFLGPANPVVFIAPRVGATAKQSAISAEAAYRIYGFGGSEYPAEPWTDERFIFRRTASSGNQNAIAQTLGLPADRFRGTDSGGSSKMKTVVESSMDPSRTIGMSSSEIVDTQSGRGSLRTIAYQHFGQPAAFYPDANPNAYDKSNVRDGHYYIWVSLHVYARTTQGGEIVGAQANNGLGGRLVPQCAMRVTRDKEGGPLRPFKPNLSCECAFDLANPSGVGRPECKTCADNTQCSGERARCSFGYCEK
jgi:hypothetical protein